ncbi:MAG: DNA internalization-related competence protein ComEC/Rec2 [Oscillospiraceae bacterium]|nr:DNA internalization-related competence protein ComEC/Rec2 [Oscillospiraceae bacterium]
MRWLMWFAIGFTMACAAGVYLISGWWLLVIAAFCGVICVALLLLRTPLSKKLVHILLGCVIGFLWLWCFDKCYLLSARQLDGQIHVLQIQVTDYSQPTASGISAEGKIQLSGKTYSVQFYINEDVTLSPGDRVEGGFKLRYTGGGSEDPTYHRGKGIFLLCYPKGSNEIFYQALSSPDSFPVIWRQKILSFLDTLFPRDTAPFAKALLLGETEDLPFETRWSLKASGVYHVVAVSGLHVSILFALVSILCLRHRVLTAVIGLPVLFLFAAVAGFSPSIVRACIMQSLVILALLVDKEYDPPTALAAAVLLMLGVNPLTITSVSFQLSVGCMLGILLFSQRIHDYLIHRTKLGPAKGKSLRARLTRWTVASVSVSLGAMSVTMPLCAIYFGSVSLVGIVTNVLILWFISFIFYGIMAACLLGAIWLPLGTMIGWLLSWPIQVILWVTDMISRLPVAAVYTSSIYIVAWLIFCYILVTVFLKIKKKQPVLLVSCILAGLLGAVACSWIEPRLDDYRITALDVGQGQCLLLQKDGKHYLVDCGGDSDDTAADRAIGLLLSQGIFRLDGLIVTHYDADHAGGASNMLSRIPADTIYLPVLTGENALRDAMVRQYGSKIHWVEEDLVLEEAEITIYPAENTEDTNESSLCILFQPADCDILITGDRSFEGEFALMEHTDLPDLEILVAGHHGSRTSTSWELLNATRPEIVIISVGKDNGYGHPTGETLERLKLFGCGVYRTDLEGTIIFRG